MTCSPNQTRTRRRSIVWMAVAVVTGPPGCYFGGGTAWKTRASAVPVRRVVFTVTSDPTEYGEPRSRPNSEIPSFFGTGRNPILRRYVRLPERTPYGDAAVQHDLLSGDVRPRVRRQVDHGLSHLLGATEPTDRDLLDDLGVDVRVGDRGGDRAGRGDVHPDAVAGVLRGDRPGQAQDARLHHAVRRLLGGCHEAGDRADADDRPAGSLVQEDAERRPDRAGDVPEVDLVDRVPVLVGHLVQLHRGHERDLPADDGDEYVEPAELLGRGRYHRLDVARRTDVSGHRVRRTAACPHRVSGLLG